MTTEQLLEDESAPLLSQANLFRMRRQWEEASTCCMQVLYGSPENWRAHALLGDIYADQGRPEEAIQWYCMTLDIKPDAHSVRDKLSRIVNSRRAEIARSIDPTGSIAGRPARSAEIGAWRRVVSRPAAGAALWAVVGAGIVVAVILPAWIGRPARGTRTPLFAPAGATQTGPTVLLQPVVPAADPPAQAPSGAPTGVVRAAADERLTDSLATDPSLRADGILVTDAQVDPPASQITVTYVTPDSASALVQGDVLREALAVARAALARPDVSGYSQCLVRCLAVDQSADASAPPQLVFVGSVSRAPDGDLPVMPGRAQSGQLAAQFAGTWWNPAA